MKKSAASSILVNGENHDLPSVVTEGSTLSRVSLDMVPLNRPLPVPLYLQLGAKWIMFRRHGDELAVSRMKSLRDQGVTALYIPKVCWRTFMDVVEKLEASGEDRVPHIRALLIAVEEEYEQGKRVPGKELFDRLRTLTDGLVESIFNNPQVAVQHIRQENDPLSYNSRHAVNTAVYGTLIGMSLKYPLPELRQLGFACLVHDIGNIFIPKSVLQKKGPLTPEEFDLMKTHTSQGAELLQNLGANSPVVAAVLGHHERVDGKGYPKGISGKQIHPFAKICAIADVYDAITSHRPHQEKLSAAEAMRRMRSQEGLFDMEFLAKMSFDKIK